MGQIRKRGKSFAVACVAPMMAAITWVSCGTATPGFEVIGQQGIVRFVVVSGDVAMQMKRCGKSLTICGARFHTKRSK